MDESKVGTKDVSQSKIAHVCSYLTVCIILNPCAIYYSSKVGKQESLDHVKVTTSTDEKLMKVTESAESTTAAESVSIMLLRVYVYINTVCSY